MPTWLVPRRLVPTWLACSMLDSDVAGLLEADFDVAGLLEADFVDAALEVERFRTVRLAGGSALSAVGCGAVAADSGTVP